MTPAAFWSSKPCSCGWTAQMLSRGVAAHADLGGGRGEEQLLGGDLGHERLQRLGLSVTDDAGHLQVVHGEDHPARGAGLGELGHRCSRLAQRGADAAELDGDQRAEQTLGLERLEGLEREPRAGCRRRRPRARSRRLRSWPRKATSVRGFVSRSYRVSNRAEAGNRGTDRFYRLKCRLLEHFLWRIRCRTPLRGPASR